MAPPKRIVGIKKGVPDDSSDPKSSHGLIRVNASSLVKSVFDPRSIKLLLTSIKTTFLSALVSVDGILANALLAAIHFIQIAIIPIISPIIFFLALCEMTTFQGDVYARPVTFFDFYTTNRLNPWWRSTPYITEVAWIHLYVLASLIFALLEQVSRSQRRSSCIAFISRSASFCCSTSRCSGSPWCGPSLPRYSTLACTCLIVLLR